MKFSAVLTGAVLTTGCVAQAVVPDIENGQVNQATMAGHEHILTDDVREHKNNGLGIQARDVDEAETEAENHIIDNLMVSPNCVSLGNCTVEKKTKSSSAVVPVTVCKTCTKFTTVTRTATHTTTAATVTTTAAACGGKTPCPAACPADKPCGRPCGADEEPCHAHEADGPRCCRKKPAHGDHGGHGGHGVDNHPPQHPGKYYEPLYDEDGILMKRPKDTNKRDGAIDLWSEEGYTGHRGIYGRKINTCDTLETLTHAHMGFGKSAHLRWRDTCCQLFSARGCNGDFMMLAGDAPSLAPYDFDNKVKSVRCMSADRCHDFYHNEEWRHHG